MTGHARAALTAMLGLVGLVGTADARITSPASAPRAWVAYAEGATAAITDWLNGADPSASTFRAALLTGAPTTDPRSATVVLSVWVDRGGRLSRVALLPFQDPGTERDLTALLIGRPLGVPPRGMRQPMRLAITVEREPEVATTVGGSL